MKPQWLINVLDYSAELLHYILDIVIDKSDQFSLCNDRNDHV